MGKILIVAEIGNTHEGSVGLAKCLVRGAAECGADAVKFQTHLFEAESLPNAPAPSYFKDEPRKSYFERTAFNLEQYRELKRFAEEECRVEFLSSPFSLEAVDLLEAVGVRAYKIPSGEVTNIPLLEKVARTGKRVLLSSGMSTWEELDAAVASLKANGTKDLTLLQCTSRYPCPPEESGLNLMAAMKERYGVPVGYSDHTLGLGVPAAAAALGAAVIEKHFTLSKKMYGSDAKNSLEPDEMRLMVAAIREAEAAATNHVDKDNMAATMADMKKTFEKSIVAAHELPAGTVLSPADMAFKKPGDGITAGRYRSLVGKKTKKKLSKDHPFGTDDFE
jgi:N-acetylneuraminate synthase